MSWVILMVAKFEYQSGLDLPPEEPRAKHVYGTPSRNSLRKN
jgi:hypothetical protein